ncbi:hypothetical protein PWY87_34095 [Kribbella solani]|uniref:hypothetical protein n=1 Tax=Kribbella solani TaxID=236067 RepID=UPI0029BCDC6B|nr:hypothetical protein [Kribbella solani]MDX3006749.1 hypothetical protein [Kribbella solani]
MDPLNLTQNADGTLTIVGEFMQQATVTDAVWDQLAANEHVTVDHREWEVEQADGSTVPAESTAVYITATNCWLNYTVTSHETGLRALELGAFATQ